MMNDGDDGVGIDIANPTFFPDYLCVLPEPRLFHGWLRQIDGSHDEVEGANHRLLVCLRAHHI